MWNNVGPFGGTPQSDPRTNRTCRCGKTENAGHTTSGDQAICGDSVSQCGFRDSQQPRQMPCRASVSQGGRAWGRNADRSRKTGYDRVSASWYRSASVICPRLWPEHQRAHLRQLGNNVHWNSQTTVEERQSGCSKCVAGRPRSGLADRIEPQTGTTTTKDSCQDRVTVRIHVAQK